MSLELRQVSAGYQGNDIITGVDMEVRPGEIVVLLGANGAGKSTLLKAISGLISVSTGTIAFEDAAIEGLRAADRVRLGVVHVPEGRQIFPGLSVAENLRLGAYLRQLDREGLRDASADVLRFFPALLSRLQDVAGNLSGGQQQMLAIARGLMAQPRLMLLDEPSLGLAPKLVAEIFGLIAALRTKGISILLAEQNARLSLSIADRGYVMENGRITLEGLGQALLHSKEVAAKYLGVTAAKDQTFEHGNRELASQLRQILAKPY